MICQICKSLNGTEELHACPYDEEINGNDEKECNCCDECKHQCAMDI